MVFKACRMRCGTALRRIRPLKCRKVEECRKHVARSSLMQMICLIDSLCRMLHVRHRIRHGNSHSTFAYTSHSTGNKSNAIFDFMQKRKSL